MRETWVRSVGQEDPLEKETATHSSILAWSIPWKEEPGGLQSMGLQRFGHNWATSLSLFPIQSLNHNKQASFDVYLYHLKDAFAYLPFNCQ